MRQQCNTPAWGLILLPLMREMNGISFYKGPLLKAEGEGSRQRERERGRRGRDRSTTFEEFIRHGYGLLW